MPPATSFGEPSTISDPICPDTNTKSPARTADENGYGHGSTTLMNSGAAGTSGGGVIDVDDPGACAVQATVRTPIARTVKRRAMRGFYPGSRVREFESSRVLVR